MKKSEAVLLVRSDRFGAVEVEASKVIQIPSGLVGYQKPQTFVLFDYVPPFHWLQSIDDPALAFVVVDGTELVRQFDMPAPYGDQDINLKEGDEYAVILIVTLKEPVIESTVNLLAPIFINLKNRRGVQVVYDDDISKIQYRLFKTN